MDISQVTTVELHGSGRRRPPKLKTVDRTVSMIVDNYTPLTSATLSARNAGPLVINMDEPPPSSRRSSPNISDDIFRGSHNQSSSSMENNMDIEYPITSMRKSSSFRRGETIDMMDLPSTVSTSLQHLRKTPSFHSPADEETVTIVPLSRHYSVRHHTAVPSTFKSTTSMHHSQQQQQQQLQQQQEMSSRNISSSSSSRRNCSMHRSFHEPQKRQIHTKRDIAVKSNSFSSDEQSTPVQQSHILYQQQQHSSMQFPSSQQSKKSHQTMEGELYRSRSNSRSNSQGFEEAPLFLDVWKPSPMPSPQPGHSRKSPSPRPSSSNSLDQVLSQGSVIPRALSSQGTTAKMLRHQHTVAALNPQFLAPIPLLALDKSFENVFQIKSPVFDMKKTYSLKYKNGPSGNSKENRELFKSRKSKSFITDTDPLDVPFALSPNLSPAGLSASGSIKKHHSPLISPLPQTRNKILLEEMKRRSGDGADLLPPDPSSFPIEFGTMDFNTIYQSYRAQQKATTERRHKNRRKKSSSSVDKKNNDEDSESIAKRKRITCIVMTVFLGLVVFAVLAVIVTLTHASVDQVNNQTIPTYTFIRKEYRPVHHKSIGTGGN